jgi:drug/metabolite transporter (DMT)-like permease
MTAVLTIAAMFAFAANSILCRLALDDARIDPASFTAIRLASGALLLVLLVRTRPTPSVIGPTTADRRRRWTRLGPAFLLLYAAGFSYAYLSLDAGTGALILFGCVQLTMFAVSVAGGSPPRMTEWIGLAVALTGLAWLVAPGVTAPSPGAAALMALAGIGWGAYSLLGRGSPDPVRSTERNFVGSIPLVVVLVAVHASIGDAHASVDGIGLAIACGAITSALGYTIWYAALRGLTAIQGSLVQLVVPVLAAAAALPLLGEPITTRLLIGGSLVLGGVGGAMLSRR